MKTPLPPPKPKMRGVFHAAAAVGSLIAGIFLLLKAPESADHEHATFAIFVYLISLVGLFVTSAIYHIPHWKPRARRWLRRMDHSAIFFLIAGTFTPIAYLALPPESSRQLLWLIWAIAAVGIVKSLVWIDAPKWLVATLCLGMGWIAAPYVGALAPALGVSGLTLLGVGGLVYTLGAVAYALKRPDPAPRWFGYHEIFHVLVIIGAGCHYAAIYGLSARV